MSEIFGTCNYCGAQLNTALGCPNTWCSSNWPKPTDYEARKAEFCRSCAFPTRADALGAQVLEQAARIAELEKEDENVVSSINSSIEFLRSSERAEHHLRIAAESRLADYGRSCRCDGCAMSFQAECPRVGDGHALAAALAENERIRHRLETIANEHGGPVPVLTVEAAIDHIEGQLNAQLVALRARATDPGRVDVRESVRWFAERMERKLRENDHKGGWRDCKIGWLVKRMNEEIDEMCNAHVRARMDQREGVLDAKAAWEKVIDEAADVANFAMMIADQARSEAAADGPAPGGDHVDCATCINREGARRY